MLKILYGLRLEPTISGKREPLSQAFFLVRKHLGERKNTEMHPNVLCPTFSLSLSPLLTFSLSPHQITLSLSHPIFVSFSLSPSTFFTLSLSYSLSLSLSLSLPLPLFPALFPSLPSSFPLSSPLSLPPPPLFFSSRPFFLFEAFVSALQQKQSFFSFLSRN